MNKLYCLFLFLMTSAISDAQIIDAIYFINEDNRITFFDDKTIASNKIINVEIECPDAYKSSIQIEQQNCDWFINPKYAGTAYLKLTGENRKKKTLKVLFMELPSMVFSFETNENYNREEGKPFLDSLNKWEELNPDFELKRILKIYPKNLPLETYTVIDSAFVDIHYEGKPVIQNRKFRGSAIPQSLVHEIIKYPPAQLTVNFKKVYLTICGFQLSKKFEDITFDFRK